MRSTLYWSRPDQTFHEFLLDHLKLTLGKEWYFEELDRPAAERHQIIRWFDAAVEHNKRAVGDGPTGSGRVYEATATGDTWALLNLAYDVLQLRHRGELPREVLDRLRSREGFQGARHEIATAATFVRAGFEIKFVQDQSGKHRELDAVDRGTGLVIGVETKSRHRPGVLGYPGIPDETAAARGDIEPLIRQALEQDPGDRPFVICVEVNAPSQPGVPVEERAWYQDVISIVGALPIPTPEHPEQFTALLVTNWSFHWDAAKPANRGEYAIVASPYARHRLPEEVLGRIRAALASYGDIPPDV